MEPGREQRAHVGDRVPAGDEHVHVPPRPQVRRRGTREAAERREPVGPAPPRARQRPPRRRLRQVGDDAVEPLARHRPEEVALKDRRVHAEPSGVRAGAADRRRVHVGQDDAAGAPGREAQPEVARTAPEVEDVFAGDDVDRAEEAGGERVHRVDTADRAERRRREEGSRHGAESRPAGRGAASVTSRKRRRPRVRGRAAVGGKRSPAPAGGRKSRRRWCGDSCDN